MPDEQELITRYKKSLEDIIWQFSFKGKINDRKVLHTAGLSVLEDAFELLGWDDPHYVSDGEIHEHNLKQN